MKKILRLVMFGLIGLVLIVGVAFGTMYASTESKRNQKIEVQVEPVALPSDEASLTEGKRLVQMRGCADCHGEDYAGKIFAEAPPIGRFAGVNLTSGEGSAVTHYQDIDWVRSIRYGVSPKGRPLIFMPSNEFYGISDEELGKMIAYLKTLPKVDRQPIPIVIGPLARVLSAAGQMPLLFSYEHVNKDVKPAKSVQPAASVSYGAYLAQGCVGCHGEGYSGGAIPGVPPEWPKAANLTASGSVHTYTLEQFKKVIREGLTPEGRQIDPMYMPWKSLAHMNDMEIEALYMFIRELPARKPGTR